MGVRIYWYGAGSEILDETDLSGNFQLEMVYFGGKRVAHRTSSNVIYYYEGDLLGSARTIVQAGQTSVCYDADFSPFGGERVITDTCSQNYKFEGKKRDNETGNDDFGARYYRWNVGRWLSADWSAVPAPVPYANLTNPQTLNLYAMVSDNPETFADLDGHVTEGSGPYNLETGDSSAGSDGQGHTCDKMGSDCTMQENANANLNGNDQDQVQQKAQQQNVTITYDKDVPHMQADTEKYVTGVLNAAGVKSANIDATTNGKHAPTSWHPDGEAVDINQVNGQPVRNYSSDPAVKTTVNAIQGAANDKRNGIAHENYGPGGLFKNGRAFSNAPLQRQHENHVHLTVPFPRRRDDE